MIKFQQNINLASYTTFGLDATAKLFVEILSEEDFIELLSTPEWKNNDHLFLGNGANILFTKNYEGLVVKVNIQGKKVIEQTSDKLDIEVGAGEDWNNFVLRTIDQGWAGIENMVAIPSSVGAAAFGNIGAYGMEAKDRIISVRGINISTKESLTLTNPECLFGYRESIFKQQFKDNFLITHVSFSLCANNKNYNMTTNYRDIQQWISEKHEELNPKSISNAIVSIRASKLPDRHQLGTAGSFFKNPRISKEKLALLKENFVHLVSFDIPNDPEYIKLSAGQLIELAGFKGFRTGNVGVYYKHALILVNYGGAKSQEIVSLAGSIQNRVSEMFGVTLEPEVIYV